MEEFKKLGLGKALLQIIEDLKFEEPTEIQEKTIPPILRGEDVIGKSATGSGKTLAFGSGIIENTIKGKGVQALILTPTRELAEQVARSIRLFSKYHELSVLEVYGGVSIEPQIRRIESSEIIVGTPGRILDHLNRRTLNLQKIRFLVLDEADRMVDMGFLPDVEKIIKLCPKKRQTLLFSATVTPDVDYMASHYMTNPQHLSAESHVDPSKLTQYYYDVPSDQKFSLLIYLLKKDTSGLMMVFCNTRDNADFVAENLSKSGLHAVAIHGRLTQSKRSSILEGFHKKRISILVCTDVAARGLDIKDVSHIYNYDIPKNSNDYIHRIGRTARAGEEGKAVSLVSSFDYDNFRKVKEDDSLNIPEKQLPEFPRVYVRFSRERKFNRYDGGDRGPQRGRRQFSNPRRDVHRSRSSRPGSGRRY